MQNNSRTIYLSGPMSGLPDFNAPAFNTAAKQLRNLGYTVINPAENNDGDHSAGWTALMHQDVVHVVNSTDIVVLPGWEHSKGAQIEVALGVRLEKPIHTYESVLTEGLIDPIQPTVTIDAKIEAGGTKHDSNKIRYDLVPPIAIKELAKVLMFGADKYGDYNYMKGFKWTRIYAATMRHLQEWYQGEEVDQDSQISHLTHAMCNLVFLLVFRTTHPELDDRFFKAS